MRAIAEEAFAMVREYKGSHSGEHGDGLVRSEFHEPMFGSKHRARLRGGEGRIRSRKGMFNPGKIVRPPKMDDRSLYPLPARLPTRKTRHRARLVGPGAASAGAVEMCNNNGECRKFDAGVMCPSYRATL